MTEKEKAAKGLLYNANYDQELVTDREQAKEALYHYNHLHPAKVDERKLVIRNLLSKTGHEFTVEPPFYCDYGYNIEISDNSFINRNCYFMDGGKIKIGQNVFIGPSCGFYTAIHPTNAQERNEGLEMARPIEIGDNVWLGGNVVLLPGVKIGSGSIIGAGSIVTKDIPEKVIAVGNPCKVLKQIA